MRILHILNEVREIGNGIVNVTVDLACLQAQNGYDVMVVSGGGEYEVLLSKYGVKHYLLDQSRTPANIFKAAWNYRKIVSKFQPDIVHAHMMTGIILAKLWQSVFRYALVSTVHNEFQRSAVVMGLADRVIAVSNAVAESMKGRGISPEKIRVIRNGTLGSVRTKSLEEYQPMELMRPAISTVAGMYKRKGITELINAFAEITNEFPNANLYLVGNGPDREMFEEQAKKTAVQDKIHFVGFQSEPQRYLLSTDIFVLASHKEPFGLVISEAREAGCAIIASDVDGIPEAVDGGKAGILVPPVDSHGLAAALKQLLVSPEKLQEWQQKAKTNLESLSVQRVHQENIAIYKELMV
ncbi:MAG: glycosyltransferase family 4 protein [Cyanobacteria bacterium P01_A01_bin.84]